jgi:hypothetical protein
MNDHGGEKQREHENWWDRIASGLAVDFATTIAVLYAVGLLIVNLDLGRYDVVAIDLARPEYVMVGLLWAILVSLTIAVIWFTIWFVRDRMRPIARSQYFEATGRAALFSVVVTALFFVLPLYVLMLMVVCGGGLNDIFQPWFLNLVMDLVIQASLAFAIVWAFVLFKPLMRGEHRLVLVSASVRPEMAQSARILALFLAIGSSVSLGLAGLFLYTQFVYSQIPREWGGSRKPVVELYLTEKLPVFADRKDIPSTIDGKRVGPVICILETERVLVVASLDYPYLSNRRGDSWSNKGGETFAIYRKVVTAVAYEGHYSPSSTSSSPAATSPYSTSSPSTAH